MRRAFILAGLVTLIALGVSAYAYSASGKSRVIERPEPVADGVNVILDLKSVDIDRNQITLRAELVPRGRYLNEAEDTFAVPLRVTTKYVVSGPAISDVPAGQPVGNSYELVFPIDGDAQRYPLDRYEYSYTDPQSPGGLIPAPLIRIDTMVGNVAKPAIVSLWSDPGSLEGWTEQWNVVAAGPTLKAKLIIERSGGLLAFVTVVVALFIVVVGLTLVVAWSAFTGRKPAEAPFASWFAVMLFALIPLRINLPGAPPIGAWIDVLVFYWIEIALLAAMVIFIAGWFRFRRTADAPEVTS